MKKSITSKILAMLGVIFIVISMYTYSLADVGSFDRYDSGSSSDWGSSSSDWSSSSSDWGSSYDYDYDYSGSTLGMGKIMFVFLIFVTIVVINAAINGRRQKKYPYHNNVNYNQYRKTNDSINSQINLETSKAVAQTIKQIDPIFSMEKIVSYTKDLFVKLQNAWTAREWEPMRPFENRELFEQHKAQIQGYIDTNKINVMDRIAVNYAYLYKFRQEGDKEILEIVLNSTMKDYIIDATTKELLEGSKTQDRNTTYKLTFERKAGVKTKEETGDINTTNCPNCGAPTQITSSGKCEYCGSIITTGDYGWVLSGLEPFRN